METASATRRRVLAAIVIATVLWPGTVDAIASSGGAEALTGGAASAGEAQAAHHRRNVATWFGPGFYGKRTACGQILTRQVLGVAHRTLPCGTLVRLTYRDHSVVVPVIDRGPYTRGVTWDLTAGTAHALGLEGTARIATHVVGQAANTPSLGTPAGSAASPQTGSNAAG